MATSRLSLTLCCPIYSRSIRGRSDNSNVASSAIIEPAITRLDICLLGYGLPFRNIPLLAEEGWLRHQKNAAKPPSSAAGVARSASPIGEASIEDRRNVSPN